MKASLYLLILWLLALPESAQSQAGELIFSHSIPASSPTAISQDRSSHVYLLDGKYNLLRLDPLGRPLDTFSPPMRGRISTIEAWNPMKMLLFYQDRQELVLLDRFMRPISSISLSDINYQGIAKAASLAADDGFWLFDETNVTLSKLDVRLRKPTVETTLNLILDKEHFDVRMLREYQNMVYLLDYNSGIFVFDNLGNYLKKIPYKGVSYIGFRNNELYFVQEDNLHFLDLYTLEEHTQSLPPHKPYLSAIVNDSRAFLFGTDAADVYVLE